MAATRLLVNADDYGLTPAVSAGIRQAHRAGIVTSATAMMIFPNTVQDLLTAREETPELAFGVHLVASEYAPLLESTGSSLRNSDGLFHHGSLFFGTGAAELVAGFDLAQLRDEWRAQIEQFLELGIPLDHLDSHHHVSFLQPALFELILEFAREYNAPIRLPIPGEGGFEWLNEASANLDVRHPDGFLGSFYDRGATLEHLLSLLENLPAGDFELMCHPGFVDPQLMECTTYNIPREREIEVLTDPQVRAFLDQRGIELVSFEALR